ncbi:MAG: Ig-like domain-containing protein, partial [Bacteroidaceae bacterium]|nr:Ig-like domain-containing protein [Bacteroidaceae bacterium]
MKATHKILFFLSATLLIGCARPGTPDGGPYDETPPQVVGASPAEGSIGATPKTIEIFFDEYIKLENASDKIVISPPQLNQPEISANGSRIKVKLIDSLKPNTTYTIDFGDAIVDNNEGNPMGKYTYTFSTG